MENTRNLCSSYLLWVWNIKDLLISPLVDSYTTRCFSCWEHEMRLPGKKTKQYSKLFQNPQAENTKCLGSPCQVFYLLFLRIGASAASVASSSKKSDSSTSHWGHSHCYQDCATQKQSGTLIKNWKCTESSDKPPIFHVPVLRALGTALLFHQHGQGSTASNGRKLTHLCKTPEKNKNSP